MGLKTISIHFPKDVYMLALWVLANDLAYSKRHSGTRRTTIHGLSLKLSYLTDIDFKSIKSQFVDAGFSAEATIEPDGNNHPHDIFQLITGEDEKSSQEY
ncbi:hypothetical protein MEN41_14390 [Dolichospermum sp. ST_con]|nr:hypothetical protein [Dolichospermum sp. ST_con]MDD1421837.1 hypothetical protein [Dolichospermum sp. ST_sed1]MDD1427456.1 hypothetical protein [Dolichospermum sp. ST_sed9]MDD1433878.1 hypothetical protein [Dolichospermum sp. ST_sed6]MDD1443214.1 hypothetical protein [Dolichospermum sp. ST_sed3]MDD1448846.1 hypothetical protein [Dolichospermum sp. ST_sed8]MDD1457430.1 hypothetical protein [Dolichospermum sp. ST_sed7]MDD1462927.1 hypothetical protein [Dolichospermum sp. ST_sed2]MDD1467786